MKVHTNLEELLEDFSLSLKLNRYWTKETLNKLIINYASSNSLALGKPEPLAKNKQCDDDFFCEWSVAHDMDNQKCDAQCIYCKSH